LNLIDFKNVYPRIGCDESGKGDFIGPLVAVALYLNEKDNENSDFIRDSKKLSDSFIMNNIKKLLVLEHSVVKINPFKYNELYLKFKNINKILGWAHATAINNLIKKKLEPKVIIVDKFGPEFRVLNNIKNDDLKKRIFFFNKAEQDKGVAAASMLARYYFIKEMDILSKKAGIKLPYGASSRVDNVVKELINKVGKDNLKNFVKLHFKNLKKILD